MDDICVVITAAGGLGYPSFVKALRCIRERKIKIVGVASEKNAVGFGFVDKSYPIPHADKKTFIPRLMGVCKAEKVDVIISPAPWELETLSKNEKKFRKIGTAVSVSSLKSLKVSMDKYLLMKHCLSIGVPVPEFCKVNSLNSFRRAANELGYPGNEVCFKPRSSAGSRGFRILSAKKNRLTLLLKQEGGSVFTTLDEVAAILGRAKKFPELLVMKYLPKEEYSVDVLADKGRPIVVIPRIRKKIGMGASIVGETVKHKRIIRYTRKLVNSLRLNGIVGLQFVADRDSIPRLTEVNPRPHGAVAFSIVSGANLLYFAIKLALGEQIKVPRVYWGAKVYRYFGEAYMLPHERSFRIL